MPSKVPLLNLKPPSELTGWSVGVCGSFVLHRRSEISSFVASSQPDVPLWTFYSLLSERASAALITTVSGHRRAAAAPVAGLRALIGSEALGGDQEGIVRRRCDESSLIDDQRQTTASEARDIDSSIDSPAGSEKAENNPRS